MLAGSKLVAKFLGVYIVCKHVANTVKAFNDHALQAKVDSVLKGQKDLALDWT